MYTCPRLKVQNSYVEKGGRRERGLTTHVFVREKHRSTGSHVGDENTQDVKEEEERKVH